MDLQAKIPDTEKCLDEVATLQAKKGTGESTERCKHIPIPYTLEQIMKIAINLDAKFSQCCCESFPVVDGQHKTGGNAKFPKESILKHALKTPIRYVCGWLGANVML
ncbi:prefoldin 3 [Actinidia rufa]|uniref:Prefoldin 3 n=1 Tax=Actinidia rufa TaxID=165716 RepID=A0A7J0GT45_9ERIC|nr:prefoldin 3 [Actinidia rufa]